MPDSPLPTRFDEYRDMQRSIPGVEGLYGATRAILDASLPEAGRVLVVGAGGGRELELFHDLRPGLRLLAVDISTEKLEQTKAFMDARGFGENIEYAATPVEATPSEPLWIGATSLLVMHFLPDSGVKLRFLQAIRSRLMTGAPFIIADISFDDPAEFKRTVPVFLRHAQLLGVSIHHAKIDPEVIPDMPIIDDQRTRDLLAQAGFGEVTPFFRGFWYAGWWCQAI